MKETKIINLFGGPGVGKSTTAAKVYHELQMRGYECDLPYEFPKQVAWEDNKSQITDQLFIFAGQHRNIIRSYGKVDYIILDSPILLSIVYKNLYNQDFPSFLYGKNFDSMILDIFKYYNNTNFFITRNADDYVLEGRLQSYHEACEVDNKIKKILKEQEISYIDLSQTHKIADTIIEHILISEKLYNPNIYV